MIKNFSHPPQKNNSPPKEISYTCLKKFPKLNQKKQIFKSKKNSYNYQNNFPDQKFVILIWKTDFLYSREKIKLLHFRCVLNTALLFLCQQSLTRFLTNNIQSLFVKRFYFSIFHNTFIYTQIALVFYLLEDFYIIHSHIVAFCFSLPKKH